MKKTKKPGILASQRRFCAECGAEFTPRSGVQKYCSEHKNSHIAHQRTIDRRRQRSAERPADYYKPKQCAEPGCDVVFVPRTGSAKYCAEHQKASWARHNPEKALESARRAQRWYRHRAEFGDGHIYEKLVERDGEQCGICNRTPEPGWHLAVDHCHDSGEVRGLLCPRCNTGLGYFEHQPERLQAAARFLFKHAPL